MLLENKIAILYGGTGHVGSTVLVLPLVGGFGTACGAIKGRNNP